MHAPRPRTRKKEEHSSTYWIVFTAACAFVLGWTWYATRGLERDIQSSITDHVTAPPQSLTRAWIELDFGDGRKRIFEGTVDHHQYLLKHSLEAAAGEARLKLAFRDGILIRIENTGNPAGVWSIYRNGKRITDPLVTLIIRRGNRYTFRFERSR